MAKNSFSISNLSCSRSDRILFSDLNFSLTNGQALQITGANGAGKTSLLKILAGLITPDAGEIRWDGHLIKEVETDFRSQLVYLGHKIGIKLGLTVLENLRLATAITLNKMPCDLNLILQQVQLEKYVTVLTQNLSAGQRQRLALARLLIANAKLWILDEPFTALDKMGVSAMQAYFVTHLKQGGMLVMTSHQAITLPDINLQQINI